METLYTTSTSNETMDIEPIILRQNEHTRLVFCPKWVISSSNPLRGGFRFQRKGVKDTWVNVEHKALSTLKKDEGYELNLTGEDMAKLFSELEDIKKILEEHGHSSGQRTFVLSEANAGGVFLQIGDEKRREWVISQLKVLERENFENLGSAIGRARLENAIEEFEKNITNKDENFWQMFFEERPWILQQAFALPVVFLNGETYLGGKNSSGRQGRGGSATDFLFMNGSNGSFAVVEVKTPDCSMVGACYRGCEGDEERNRVYRIHGDLTGGIVQMENQIHIAIQHFKTQIGEDFPDITHLNPSGVLIAGNYSSMTISQQRSLDLFRKSLGKNQIITFDELLEKLRLLKAVYEN